MYLSDNKIKYVFYHLWQHASPDTLNDSSFLFVKETDGIPDDIKNKVIFILSHSDHPAPVNVLYQDKQLPILFGLSNNFMGVFRKDEKGNVIFNDDLLSSIFYLLSGQQEVAESLRDKFGRFSYDHSIQKKLNCVQIPLVNYYFEMILEGIEFFARENDLKIERRRLFGNFGFVLSHDVDRISFFHPLRVLYKMKQIIGLTTLKEGRIKTLKSFFYGVLFNLNPFRKADPWWNFDWMIDFEKHLGIRSTFFFLKQEDWFDNSLYTFNFKKIKNLIKRLNDDEFEVGLHGTMRSGLDVDNMLRQTTELTKVLGKQPIGIRQHYLRFFHPQTFKIQEAAGLIYDTTLGFAEHDGFRNGYCYPFHPYDFENDCMMKIWEIPLVMMEVSVLYYRNESFLTLRKAAHCYIVEAQKFGGLFSLLWHNCRINDYEYRYATSFYTSLLDEIVQIKPDLLTGSKVIERIEKVHN